MPNAPKTPSRNVRVEDELWQATKLTAARREETVSDVVRRAFEQYNRENAETPHEDEPS